MNRIPKQLSLVYFPYADPRPSQALMMAALLFDKIYYLEPNFFRHPTDWDCDEPHSYVDTTLKETGLFRELGPDIMGFPNGFRPGKSLDNESVISELSASILTDLQNPALHALTSSQHKLFWSIPNGQYLFWNGLGLLLDTGQVRKETFSTEIFTSRPKYYQKFFAKLNYSTEISSFDEIRIRNPRGELMVRLPFLPVQALMMAVVLHASREFGLIPLTDSPLHQQYMYLKLNALKNTMLEDNGFVDELNLNFKYTDIGMESIGMMLPKLGGLTPEKVVKLRRKCKEELENFRIEIRRLVYEIEACPWEPCYDKKISEMINKNVIPAVKSLSQSLKSLRSEIGISMIEGAIATSPLPLLLQIHPGLPMEWTLPLSVGTVWLKETIKHFHKRNILKQNGLSFLLRLS